MPHEKEKKILIMAFQGIGNILLFTPTLEALHQNYPQAKFTVIVGSETTREILERCPYIEKLMVYDAKSFWKTSFSKKIAFVRNLRNLKFDMTVSTFLEGGFKSSVLAFLTGAPVRVGYNILGRGLFYTHRLNLIPNRHEKELGLDLVRAIGGKVTDSGPTLWLEAPEGEWAKRFLEERKVLLDRPLVAIHPGGSPVHPGKRWDIDRFAGLSDKIIEKWNAYVLLVGGKVEQEMVPGLERLMKHRLLLAVDQPLRNTAALLEKCDLLVSNDTGLSHVASAVGTPLISIFGPTNPWKNSPYGKESVVIRKDLPCSPCYEVRSGFRITCTHPDPFACLKMITVDEVLEEVSKSIKARNG